jgi:hypothetical protein
MAEDMHDQADKQTMIEIVATCEKMARCADLLGDGRSPGVPYLAMATYTINPRLDRTGFDVGVIGDDGARQTLLGFKTKAEAEAWIREDKKRDVPAASRGEFC